VSSGTCFEAVKVGVPIAENSSYSAEMLVVEEAVASPRTGRDWELWHYGADTRLIGPSECIRRAKADVRARGWTIDAITGDSTIVGAARTLLATGPNVVVIETV
jgi:hypothetical protein